MYIYETSAHVAIEEIILAIKDVVRFYRYMYRLIYSLFVTAGAVLILTTKAIMWTDLTKIGGVTEPVTLPADGIISLAIPPGITLCAYVNGAIAPMHHLHVKSGDSVYFMLEGHDKLPANIDVSYNGMIQTLAIKPEVMPEPKLEQAIPYAVTGKASTSNMEDSMSAEMEEVSALKHKVKKLNNKVKELEDMTPAETINLFANPGMGNAGAGIGAGAGAGLGAGLLGGILGGALLGNRGGLLGGADGNVGGVVTPALLASSLAQVTDTAQSTTVLQSLGDIKASIPLAEGQVQLALAGAQADINGNINSSLQIAVTGQGLINKNISEAIAASLASQNNINVNVLTQGSQTRESVAAYGVANLNATKESQFATQVAISTSTKEILAALNDQNTANLQRQLTVAENALLEQRATGRSRETEINVTQTVNQNQAQIQAQAQQQQQFLITNNLLQAILSQAQVAQATNQSLIIGNTGAVTGGAQTSNPVNVRA